MRNSFLGAVLAAGIVVAVGPSASASAGSGPAVGVRVGPDLGWLRLSTFTDTLPGEAATAFHARAGDVVRRVYVVRNDGLLPLTDVSVRDPEVSSSAFRCTRGDDDDADDADLGPLSWTTCSATFQALAGEHVGTVTATADSPILRRTLSAAADTGYTAVTPGLSASVAFENGAPQGGNLPADATVGARIRIVNSGSAELTGLRVSPPPSLSAVSCAAGSTIGSLDPGESAVCSGSLTTAAGRHDETLFVAGVWRWDHAITAQGPQPPRSYPIQTTADVAYDGVARPSPPPTPLPSPPPREHSAAAPGPLVTPPSPPPPTSAPPTPRPSPARSPAQRPVQPLVPATVQFVPSRGLSLPLKVLAIVIIPAVAAARRIAGRK
jgi:hypothetical protein